MTALYPEPCPSRPRIGLKSRFMKYKIVFLSVLFLVSWYLIGCSEKKKPVEITSFTKVDSLTERYLELQDSMLYAWNTMLNDDKSKFRAMHSLLHELLVSNQFDQEELISLEHRLDELTSTTLDPEVIDETLYIEEYDFATEHIIKELVSLAASDPSFSHRNDFRKLVEEINLIDQRVNQNRSSYDAIVNKYNTFLERNKNLVKEIDQDISITKKPLFSMTAEN